MKTAAEAVRRRHLTQISKPARGISRSLALVALGSGLLNLYSVIRPLRERAALLRRIFPLEFLHLSQLVTLLVGFALVIVSIHLYKRKKQAFRAAALLTCLSIVFHLTKGLDYEEALMSFILLVALILGRREFTVRSSIPGFRDSVATVGFAVAMTLAYGIGGFWLLDRREFGIDFSLSQAIRSTATLLLVRPDPQLTPLTRHARWFLESFYLISATAIVCGVAALFRPVLYRLRTHPQEQALVVNCPPDMAVRL